MLLCTYRVYQTCGGDFAFDVIRLSSLASCQQCFLYSQKEQSFGISLFFVRIISPSFLYVSQSSLSFAFLKSALLTTLIISSACCKTLFRSDPSSSGASTTAHSPVDLLITIQPPKGRLFASPYRCPCTIYPNASSYFILSYPLPNL